jgi:hypothetical protein
MEYEVVVKYRLVETSVSDEERITRIGMMEC